MVRKGVDVHNTNPGEELNFHGLPNDTSSRVYGKNYGYPACVAIFDSSNVVGYPGGAKTGMQMVGDQMPSSYTDEWCQRNTVAPSITFRSHLAPLDIKFRLDGRSALVSFHGSWYVFSQPFWFQGPMGFSEVPPSILLPKIIFC